MRILLAVSIAIAAACSGPTKKKEGAIVEGGETPESCCCKWTPRVSEDGKPKFETTNPMECSSKQGDCMDAVQCANAPKSEDGSTDGPPSPMQPSVDDSGPAVEKE